jgi:hypothetical protein
MLEGIRLVTWLCAAPVWRRRCSYRRYCLPRLCSPDVATGWESQPRLRPAWLGWR